MQQKIIGYHQDELGDWVAELACHHGQHVRHKPPFVNRPWVVTVAGRKKRLNRVLNCVRCDRGEAANEQIKAKYCQKTEQG
ncbi:MAG: DUF3565 domain-containing protein [Gammaproteobacteria bacterium]|nr:DUF3565 domain-containing protein [Gammaproteobacteria bacterium]